MNPSYFHKMNTKKNTNNVEEVHPLSKNQQVHIIGQGFKDEQFLDFS